MVTQSNSMCFVTVESFLWFILFSMIDREGVRRERDREKRRTRDRRKDKEKEIEIVG